MPLASLVAQVLALAPITDAGVTVVTIIVLGSVWFGVAFSN